MTFTAEDSASTEWIIDLRPGAGPTPCDTTYECPRTPADNSEPVTPLFLIGVLIPVLVVCLWGWIMRDSA